jgi:thymidylate synthase
MDIKWIKWSNIVHELLWMLRGGTNVKYLIENDCHIWTDDAYRYHKEYFNQVETNGQLPIFEKEEKKVFVQNVLDERIVPHTLGWKFGNLGKIYGYQWRNFDDGTDQVQNVINSLKSNPDDRRMIITGHNPSNLEDGDVGLPSCHNYMQFYTTINEDGSRNLNTFCNIRSNDWFLGQPYNAAQYALLTHIFAKLVNMDVGELVINAVDAHLYHEHFEAAEEWLRRFKELPINDMVHIGNTYVKNTYCKATLSIADRERTIVDEFHINDFKLNNYQPQPYIKAKLLT